MYLQLTSISALALTASPTPLSAEHQYFPATLSWTFKLNVSPDPMAFPSLNQVIFGIGFPVTEQRIVTLVPSKTVCFAGRVFKLGGSGLKEIPQIKERIFQKNASLFPSKINRPFRAHTKKRTF